MVIIRLHKVLRRTGCSRASDTKDFMVIIAVGSRLGVPPLSILNREAVGVIRKGKLNHSRLYGDYCGGVHLFPFRTEKLSPPALMVLP